MKRRLTVQLAVLLAFLGIGFAARYLLPENLSHAVLASAHAVDWFFFVLSAAFFVFLAGFGVWALFWWVRLRRWRRQQELRKAQSQTQN